jgi:hypothetical protein
MKNKKNKIVGIFLILCTLIVGLLLQPANNIDIKKANAASQVNSITTSAVSFFGGNGKDSVHAVGIVPTTKKVVMGGFLTQGQNFGLTPNIIGTGTTGALTILSNTGQSVEKIVRLGTVIDDIEVAPNGNIVVIGDGGLYVFDSTLSNVLWTKPLGLSGSLGGNDDIETGRRVDVAPNGQIGLLSNKNVYVFDSTGNQISTASYSDTYIYDIAIDNDSYYLTGFNQSSNGPCGQIQLAFVRGYYSSNTQFRWKAYGYSHDQAGVTVNGEYSNTGNNCADSRGKRLKISPTDGSLIMAGRSDGGNSVFRWDSNELFKKILRVNNDFSSNPAGGAAQTAYLIKLNPSDGEALSYVVHSARLTNANGNTYHIEGLDVGDDGEIYVTGATAAFYQDRALQTVDGKPVGTYKSADGVIMQVSPDFTKKRYLTSFGGNLCPTEGLGVAVYKGMVVTAGQAYDTCASLLDNNAIQTANQGGASDGYFAVFGDTNTNSCSNNTINYPTCNVCPNYQVLVLNACKYTNGGGIPTISLSNVTQNQVFQYGQPITLNFTVNDPENSIKNLEFFDQSEQKLGQSQPSNANTTHSFLWDLSNNRKPLPGEHRVSAVVTDNDGYSVSSLETTIYIQDNTTNSTNITMDFANVLKPVSSKLFGTNMFDITSTNLNNANYKNAVKYMNPSMVRIHNVDLMSNSSSNGHGLMKPDPLNTSELIWDRARIKNFANSIKSLRTNGYNPEYVINLNKLDVGFDAFANTTKYANLLADFVKIVNQEESLGIKYFEITNELDDDFLGSNGCPNKLYCNKAFSELIRIYNASSLAMKAQDSTIKTGGLSYQNPFANIDPFIDGTLPQGTLDFFSYHRYDSSGNPVKPTSNLLYNPKGLIKTTADSFRQKLDQKSPNKRIELFANEYNICWEYQCGFGGAANGSSDYMKNQIGSVFDALGYIAGMESGLDSLNTWNEKDNFYGKFASNYDKRHSADLLKTLSGYKAKDLTSHTTTNDPNNEGTLKSASFTTVDNKKVLMLVNRDTTVKNVKVLGTNGATYSYQKLQNKVVNNSGVLIDTPELITSKDLISTADLELQLNPLSINFLEFDNLNQPIVTTSSSSSNSSSISSSVSSSQSESSLVSSSISSSVSSIVQSSSVTNSSSSAFSSIIGDLSSSQSSAFLSSVVSPSSSISPITSSQNSNSSSLVSSSISSQNSNSSSSFSSSISSNQNQTIDTTKPIFRIFDPYTCESGISGNVVDNLDNSKVTAKVTLTRQGALITAYTFFAFVDTQGNYRLPIQGNSLSLPLYVEPGTYTVNYSAKDESGNEAFGESSYIITIDPRCQSKGVLSAVREIFINGVDFGKKSLGLNNNNANNNGNNANSQIQNSVSTAIINNDNSVINSNPQRQSAIKSNPQYKQDDGLIRTGGSQVQTGILIFGIIFGILYVIFVYANKFEEEELDLE